MKANKLSTKDIRNERIKERNAEINMQFSKMFAEGKRAEIIFEELGKTYILSGSQLRRIVKVRNHKETLHGK